MGQEFGAVLMELMILEEQSLMEKTNISSTVMRNMWGSLHATRYEAGHTHTQAQTNI